MDDHVLPYGKALDHQSFRKLMETYSSDVWHFAYMQTGRRDVADDITQDVFLRVYRQFESFRGGSSLRTWLFAITRRVAVDYRRTVFFRRAVLMGAPEPRDSHRSAEAEALSHLEITEFWDTVLLLPRKWREVLILDGKHELSTKEIAALLDIPEGTVKSRLSRARARMALLLNAEGKEMKVHERG